MSPIRVPGRLLTEADLNVTRAIGFHDNTQKDWPADYKMFSRSPWEPRDLVAPILRQTIEHHALKRIIVSVDDPRVWRTGQPDAVAGVLPSHPHSWRRSFLARGPIPRALPPGWQPRRYVRQAA